ncbi:DUF4386 domain-containing protein [Hyphomonas sp.]|uniref:DUF4386 domain-containing protein n=1 Tax=Hyphomonas sp. TaxID=87 RepID=UPI0035294821
MTSTATYPAHSFRPEIPSHRSPALMKFAGRLTGGLYLLLALIGGSAYFLVSETLIVHGDAATTTHNIIANAGLFRAGAAAWLATALIDIVIAYLLYWIFSPATPRLALMSMVFRLVYVAVHAAALTNLLDIIMLIDQGAASGAPDTVLRLAEAHLNGFMVSLLFFGVHLMILAVMICRTGALPKLFAVLLMLAGLAYAADTFALALLPTASAASGYIDHAVTILATAGEIGFLLWLLVAGFRTNDIQEEVTS